MTYVRKVVLLQQISGVIHMGYNFQEDLKKGRYAELKFMGHMQQCRFDYTDVSKVKMYQNMDIDVVVHDDKEDIDVEVKSDEGIAKYKDHNISIETISSRRVMSDGWWLYCQAKWLFFYSPQDDCFYKFLRQDIKRFMDANYCREVDSGNGKCKLVQISKLCAFLEHDIAKHKLDVSKVMVDREKLEIVA